MLLPDYDSMDMVKHNHEQALLASAHDPCGLGAGAHLAAQGDERNGVASQAERQGEPGARGHDRQREQLRVQHLRVHGHVALAGHVEQEAQRVPARMMEGILQAGGRLAFSEIIPYHRHI